MQINRWLSAEEYKETKENAYTFATLLADSEKPTFIKGQEFFNKEEELVYCCTLLYPNDLQIFSAFNESLDMKKISEKLNIPISILKIKVNEFSRYGFNKSILSDTRLTSLANQLNDVYNLDDKEIIK